MNENPAEILKRSLVTVLPGLAIGVVGSLLVLGTGVLLLTQGAMLVRDITGTLPPPWHSIALLAVLGSALILVGWSGKVFMGYLITLIRTKEGRDADAR